MPRRKPKRERRALAALGGSAVARSAYVRPGGAHGRRKPPRGPAVRRAINESEGE